ncbi:Transcriptional regulatory protein ZraR [Posidoniimonas polymericola]|uniref:Transcriptional regulatory protein ZraR n=1 Tax=Posidoniimonas polymericola TaxID=2528002 RepID=A0A5C5YQH1_9BACT|nr:sigma-54 dependent transcriptional regulator [Posidoniimonas polymericola]TWT77212.1 Transcriptional regulatory protein ZraR [Posidoniimonas polymericola]
MSDPNTPNTNASVLVVDDHAAARRSVADVLSCAGYAVEQCASAVEALAHVKRAEPDVVVTDLQMPGMNGLEFIQELTRRRHACQVLMMTAHASVQTAVDAMRIGAFDYIEKPFDVDRLEASVARAVSRRGLAEAASDAPRVIGDSPAMRRLMEQIRLIAPTDETVLICGESGVGKELIAQTLHSLSRRAAGPLVGVNCPVLSEQLAESELFGHKKGAFTGADADRVGRFEAAQGGAILLDEVTEISPQLQAKLLRVLQERVFEKVGSSEPTPLDARVVAATNRRLEDEVRAGRFREDLYYRLAVVPIDAPPLRDRGEDVLLLADHFAGQAAARLQRQRVVSDSARDLLMSYSWPGNVRELQNIITRACVLAESDQIEADLICPWLAEESIRSHEAAAGGFPTLAHQTSADRTLAEIEREVILATLSRNDGHRARTAAALGIGVRTLSGKLRDYGVPPGEKQLARSA